MILSFLPLAAPMQVGAALPAATIARTIVQPTIQRIR
jgi:hypothetical protein